ncbi:hypothetical protein [Bradyrhizobium mercantei]|uniref:hypothetical protein n=1 Tax=Bradyrhizobium mercantei TaxID=1904807 RepID=UPI0011788A47|nr:hypothetical protein [Bradyrhizobium mercantei]
MSWAFQPIPLARIARGRPKTVRPAGSSRIGIVSWTSSKLLTATFSLSASDYSDHINDRPSRKSLAECQLEFYMPVIDRAATTVERYRALTEVLDEFACLLRNVKVADQHGKPLAALPNFAATRSTVSPLWELNDRLHCRECPGVGLAKLEVDGEAIFSSSAASTGFPEDFMRVAGEL